MILTLKLILIHLIGDFVLQPSKWVEHKIKFTYRSSYLYIHLLVHLLLLIMIIGDPLTYWIAITVTIFSHYFIDLSKLLLYDKMDKRVLFFSDQTAHFLVVIIIAFIYEPYDLSALVVFDEKILLFAIAIIMVTIVSSVVMKTILSVWTVGEDFSSDSLDQAGKYIGILERLFIFFFVIVGFWESIGFLLAAKSVFRFGDLSKSKDRKLTEYILIGTFISFGLAIAIGLLYNYCLAFI